MSQRRPAWMDQEEGRAEDLSKKGQTANSQAPKLVKASASKAPPRMQKALYIQKKFADAFDDLAYQQKKATGKKAPELAEEAITLLLKEYGVDPKTI